MEKRGSEGTTTGRTEWGVKLLFILSEYQVMDQDSEAVTILNIVKPGSQASLPDTA